MKVVWGSFFWYMTCAFILVSSSSRYILLGKDNQTSSLIGYVTLAASLIFFIIHAISIFKYGKNKILQNHIYFVVFVFLNLISLGLVQAITLEELFNSMFPILFSFQLLLTLLSFLSEASFRELGQSIFEESEKDEQ